MRSLDPGDPSAIGGYPLLAVLGAGGMGQVFLSRTASGRPLALKTLRAEFGLDPGFEERFAREIASSDQVRSPWTASVVDYSPAGQRPQWLATEYVAAPSLSDWVERSGPLPEPAVRALAAELAEGLRAVHRAGLAHRDVKPSNVLLARRHPLLIDFGIARAADDTRHTRTGGVIGSPGYMAPEQAAGGISSEPGDVFSLGATLVYAATGKGPFLHPGENPSAAQLLYRIVHEEPALHGVPQELAPLLAACLHKAPQARPSAAELMERIGAAPGSWAAALPQGLSGDIAAREAESQALLQRPVVLPPPPQTAPPTGFGPPIAYGDPGAIHVHPPALQSGTLPSGSPSGPGRRTARPRTAAAIAGVVATAAVAVALTWPDGNAEGTDDGGRKSPTPSAYSSPSPAADALPASWVGTWKGTGPGSSSGDGVVNARTNKVSVTVTLHAADRGDVVGRQISHVIEAGSGRDIGCTETLRLQETRGTSMVFEAATSTPTDPSTGVRCVRGNIYTLTKSGADTLRLGDEGSQTAGAPTRLTRTP
ncbi:serine/threonine-protein kinase [Streptomyces torulosus]|uniref:serine/threonine-protein kinase n=1 Tax=Streptomyces torulosus TaxID=68276 RepID=UPI0006EB9710|nr:serine/threonine-protein kinase [Streptomyces torulosus]